MGACADMCARCAERNADESEISSDCDGCSFFLIPAQVDLEGVLVPKMWEAARAAFVATHGRLNPNRHAHCFELLGLDFMVDADLWARTWHCCMCDAEAWRALVSLMGMHQLPVARLCEFERTQHAMHACMAQHAWMPSMHDAGLVADRAVCRLPRADEAPYHITGSQPCEHFQRRRMLQVYLIEVNTSPALYRCCSLLAELLPPVLEEVVQRCVDPYFPPPPSAQLPVRPPAACCTAPGVTACPALLLSLLVHLRAEPRSAVPARCASPWLCALLCSRSAQHGM